MSRSGYADDIDLWPLIRWRGAVKSAARGRRGQAMLREMIEALEAMPVKRLISGALVNEDGEACALGELGKARGTRMDDLDIEDAKSIAERFGVAAALVREVEFLNDDGVMWPESAENLHTRMVSDLRRLAGGDG